jgi:hypothetical protein
MSNKTYNSEVNQVQNKLLQNKKYVMALVKRLAMLKINYASKTEFERNEIEIAAFETTQLITKTIHQISQQEATLKDLLKVYYAKIVEVDANFQEVVNFAKQNQHISLKHILYDVNWKKINENYQDKIAVYENLKIQTDLIKNSKNE